MNFMETGNRRPKTVKIFHFTINTSMTSLPFPLPVLLTGNSKWGENEYTGRGKGTGRGEEGCTKVLKKCRFGMML